MKHLRRIGKGFVGLAAFCTAVFVGVGIITVMVTHLIVGGIVIALLLSYVFGWEMENGDR